MPTTCTYLHARMRKKRNETEEEQVGHVGQKVKPFVLLCYFDQLINQSQSVVCSPETVSDPVTSPL